MSTPRVSIVIASRGRPDDLARCLTGVSQLFYPNFEVIVVADPAGLAATAPWAGQIKMMAFADANISHARNLGIAQAAGEVVAFIDDDAVPEPTWLDYLMQGFALRDVACVGGYVRGRNGISMQWTARTIGPDGAAQPIATPSHAPFVPTPPPQGATKTEGTNMAVRRDVLARLGGFDPAYRFYMDETDLNMRLARAGYATALVPDAQVHHAFAASPRRRADRVPRDLTDIGASTAVFQRRHPGARDIARIFTNARDEQHKRLLRHMVAGRLEPRDVAPVLASFQAGWQMGQDRPLPALPALPAPVAPFLPFVVIPPGNSLNLAGNVARKGEILRMAAKLTQGGNRVSVYLYSLLPKRHKLLYDINGYWLQTGGINGKSDRTKPLRLAFSPRTRHTSEVLRVEKYRRHLSDVGDNTQFF